VTPGVLALVLLAALLHASWNALVKSGGDRAALLTLTMCWAGLYGAVGLVFLPLPAPASWPFLLASVLIHQLYFAALVRAYEHGDLSQVYPIARGAAPVLVAAGGWALAGEALSGAEMGGLLLVSSGILSLAWLRAGPVSRERTAILSALVTALSIGLYSIADALGVRRAGNEIAYILWLFALSALPLMAFMAWHRRGRLIASLRPQLKLGAGAGLVTALAYGIAIWAFGRAPMAHVVALRETSVLFAALIGALLLGEPFGRRRILAATVIVAGAVLLRLGG